MIPDPERELMDDDSCQLCEEAPDAEMGLFIDRENDNTTVWSHAQCGYDADLQLA
ncbi:hypothetical protein SEA_WENTWORTH_88 [Streptomyces phage Wentworth]|nr:hypothetical protein SEA_WENTWORTH_88 [Streptomyces phage Wentworth]